MIAQSTYVPSCRAPMTFLFQVKFRNRKLLYFRKYIKVTFMWRVTGHAILLQHHEDDVIVQFWHHIRRVRGRKPPQPPRMAHWFLKPRKLQGVQILQKTLWGRVWPSISPQVECVGIPSLYGTQRTTRSGDPQSLSLWRLSVWAAACPRTPHAFGPNQP